MTNSRVFNKTYDLISRSLDISARRHNLITGNIANMDTIGYKPRDLDFQKTLKRVMGEDTPRQAMDRTHQRHFSGNEAEPLGINGTNSEDVDLFHLDSVDIDREMQHIVENNIKYRTTTEMLLRKMAILRHAIQEGGR